MGTSHGSDKIELTAGHRISKNLLRLIKNSCKADRIAAYNGLHLMM